MAHIPLNHPLRPLYRVLAGLIGAYVLVFGIVGIVRTAGDGLFVQDGVGVLGLRTNLALAILSVAFGAVILGANLLGGNLPHWVDLAAAAVFIAGGIGMMPLMRLGGNFLSFSMANIVVSFVFGLTLMVAGLYTKVGTEEQAEAEDVFRHSPMAPPRASANGRAG
jgi:hypothetical protein